MNKTEKEALSASLEDYLEAIFNLTTRDDVARSKDIADSLNVAKSSVTGALRTLAEKQLVNYKPYGYVTLTPSGKATAEKIAQKHEIIKSFFTGILGVDAAVAQEAACKAEHALGADIAERLLNFIEFVTHNNENGYNLAEQFQLFCCTKDKQSNNKELG